jgi:23S rRNA (adenine2503-C2)-methyltransferase
MTPEDLSSMTVEQLESWFEQQGERAFRGRQLFMWLHARCARTYDEMTDLSKETRAWLAKTVTLRQIRIAEEQEAEDGTRKFRFQLDDGAEVEGVFMPEERRSTLCVSTQVGCGMGCRFCATAGMGLTRNLTAGEIVGQVEAVVRKLRDPGEERPVSNVVFMGMGEPLANLEATVAAVTILLDQRGLGLSRRHLTVSTAGLVPAMGEFVHRVPVKLAVSLNATTDEVRSRIMPINDRFGLTELMDCCRNLPLQHTDRVTFEYVMLAGVNDSLDDARRLTGLLSGIRAKVNLIPFNPFEGIPFSRPAQDTVEAFQEHLISRNISAFVRRSRGESLRGACGQLVAGGSDK